MEIRVRKSTVVKPSQDTPKERIWNSNLDLLVPRIHVPTVYLYKPSGSAANSFEPSVLIEALSKVLVLFYPLAGRLGRDEDGRIDINCNGVGALFIEAEVKASLTDLGDFTPSQKLRQLVPTVDYSQDLSSYPVMVLQATFFKCGGVSIGTYIHHTLADGCSALHFVNTWSDIARGLSASVPPFLDRTLLRPRVPPNPTFHHIEYDPHPTMITHSDKISKINSTLTLRLTLDQINTLKAKSKKHETIRLSTYEILTAHIWRSMCKARGLSDDQPSKLYVATDGRARLRPPLPPGYFGNVLFTATSVAKSGDIVSNPLSQTVEKIRAALKRMDDEYLRSALDFLEMQPDLTALMRGANTFCCPNLNVVSWIRLPIHEADFGWGRPLFMGPASVVFEGMAYILPSSNNDGSLSLAICLEANHMEHFKKFLYDF